MKTTRHCHDEAMASCCLLLACCKTDADFDEFAGSGDKGKSRLASKRESSLFSYDVLVNDGIDLCIRFGYSRGYRWFTGSHIAELAAAEHDGKLPQHFQDAHCAPSILSFFGKP